MPEAEQGLNMARNIGALAGLPYTMFQQLQLIVTVLQDCKLSPMVQSELCLVTPKQ